MELLDSFKRWLGGRKTLAKVTADDLRRDRVRLEQAQKQLFAEIDALESRKKSLFDRGVGERNPRQQTLLARRVKQVSGEIKAKDRTLQMVSRQLGVVAGLTSLKENEAAVAELGLSGAIGTMDLGELRKYVEKATVKGEFQMERFAEMLNVLDSAEDLISGGEEDEDVLSIVAAMQEAGEMDDGLAEMDARAARMAPPEPSADAASVAPDGPSGSVARADAQTPDRLQPPSDRNGQNQAER